MAHYDITHTCGHDERIELFGKTSERERRIEWLQERPCTECWKKERAAEAEARKNKEAAMIVEKLGDEAADAVNALSNATCTLEGSAKQVAWANDIRKEFIEKTKADMKSADKNDLLDMKAMLKVTDNITEAADWINARRNPKIMFFDRADFWEARREIKAAEKPAKKEDSGRKPSIRDILKAKIAEKDSDGASV
mgnify:CR=1 FL=1